jgi:hypothetical protein
MNLKRASLCCLALATLTSSIYGCISTTGPATQLKLTPGFTPQKTYNAGYDQMWEKVLSSLRQARIMVTLSSKENGIITTDYIQGWTMDVAALGTDVFRYQYQIVLKKQTPSQTQVDIICKLERKHMLKGGSAREAVEQLKPFEDVSFERKESATKLELWLYEQIEKSS